LQALVKSLINARIAHSLAVEVVTNNSSHNNTNNQKNKKDNNQPEEPTVVGGNKRCDTVVGRTIKSSIEITNGGLAGDELAISTSVRVTVVLVSQGVIVFHHNSDVTSAATFVAAEDDGTVGSSVVFEGEAVDINIQSGIGLVVKGTTISRGSVEGEVRSLNGETKDVQGVDGTSSRSTVGSEGRVDDGHIDITLNENGTTTTRNVSTDKVTVLKFETIGEIVGRQGKEASININIGLSAVGSDLIESPVSTRDNNTGVKERRLRNTSIAVTRDSESNRSRVVESRLGNLDLGGAHGGINGAVCATGEVTARHQNSVDLSDDQTVVLGGDLGVDNLKRTISNVVNSVVARVIDGNIVKDKEGNVTSTSGVESVVAVNRVADNNILESPETVVEQEEGVVDIVINRGHTTEGTVGNLAVVVILANSVQAQTSGVDEHGVLQLELGLVAGADTDGSSGRVVEAAVRNGNFIGLSNANTVLAAVKGNTGSVKLTSGQLNSDVAVSEVNVLHSQFLTPSVEVNTIFTVLENNTLKSGFTSEVNTNSASITVAVEHSRSGLVVTHFEGELLFRERKTDVKIARVDTRCEVDGHIGVIINLSEGSI